MIYKLYIYLTIGIEKPLFIAIRHDFRPSAWPLLVPHAPQRPLPTPREAALALKPQEVDLKLFCSITPCMFCVSIYIINTIVYYGITSTHDNHQHENNKKNTNNGKSQT